MTNASEPVDQVRRRRDGVLAALVNSIAYAGFLGVNFARHGNELTAVMTYDGKLIGAPAPPRLHGGATAGFLELSALIELTWSSIWNDMETGVLSLDALEQGNLPPLPKMIGITVDYLSPGLPRTAYARATVNRSGRRYASVHVEAWQDRREKPFARAACNFLMPRGA